MSTSTHRRAAGYLAISAIAAVIALGSSASPASAHDIIATDPGPTTVASSTSASGPRAVASIPRGIVVTHPGSQPVVVSAQGQPTLRTPRPGDAPAVFTGLRAGTTYTVAVGGRVIARVTALDRPSAASRLVVSTTSVPGAVDLQWKHTATAATGGKAISYDVAAVRSGAKPVTVTVTGKRVATLTGLDTTALYTFSVTPRNSAGRGRPTSAAMKRSLAEISGGPAVVPEAPKSPAPPGPEVRPPTSPVAPAAPAAPASPAAPAPAPAPSTKTIYVCPAGYTEVGSLCQTTVAYSYDVKAYTYHSVANYGYGQVDWSYSAGYCTGSGTSGNWSNGDPYCRQAVYGDNALLGYSTVKDAAPAGYTDTGTEWRMRNPAPSGYLDDGTQWVKTVAKEAVVVPA